jgi:hypothetical protein
MAAWFAARWAFEGRFRRAQSVQTTTNRKRATRHPAMMIPTCCRAIHRGQEGCSLFFRRRSLWGQVGAKGREKNGGGRTTPVF